MGADTESDGPLERRVRHNRGIPGRDGAEDGQDGEATRGPVLLLFVHLALPDVDSSLIDLTLFRDVILSNSDDGVLLDMAMAKVRPQYSEISGAHPTLTSSQMNAIRRPRSVFYVFLFRTPHPADAVTLLDAEAPRGPKSRPRREISSRDGTRRASISPAFP